VLGATLSLTDTVIAWFNVLMVTVSVVVNWSAYRRGVPGLRVVHLAVSVISVFYVMGYVGLLTFVHDVANWSSAMRGLSIIAWVGVWIMPAVLSTRMWGKMKSAVLHEVVEACEKP